MEEITSESVLFFTMALLDADVVELLCMGWMERVGFIFNYFRDQGFTFLADIILGFST